MVQVQVSMRFCSCIKKCTIEQVEVTRLHLARRTPKLLCVQHASNAQCFAWPIKRTLYFSSADCISSFIQISIQSVSRINKCIVFALTNMVILYVFVALSNNISCPTCFHSSYLYKIHITTSLYLNIVVQNSSIYRIFLRKFTFQSFALRYYSRN